MTCLGGVVRISYCESSRKMAIVNIIIISFCHFVCLKSFLIVCLDKASGTNRKTNTFFGTVPDISPSEI